MTESRPHLVIGNKNYSSWSLRPWIALAVAGIDFTEEVIPLDQPDTKTRIAGHSEAGRVPVLHHGEITVWESLAILEYVAEAFPHARLWPASARTRAVARAVASEMHAGFAALRSGCPMNMRRPKERLNLSAAAESDSRRIERIWQSCRQAHAQDGPFLFGHFTAADAMFAPVVNRFEIYDVPVGEEARFYMQAIMDLPAWQSWKRAAEQEPWVLTADEV